MTIIALEALTFGLNRLADAARSRSEELILLTRDRGVYEYELSRQGDVKVVDVDTFDLAALKKAIELVPSARGLINSTDTWSVLSLELFDHFGFPGQPADSIRLVRDKFSLRNVLHDNGLSSARAIRIAPGVTAELDVVYPVIVKDLAGTGSQNVWLARNTAELDDVLAQARNANLRGGALTMEPYFAGTLFSVEALTWEGETKVLAVSSRIMSHEPDFREEAVSLPVYLPPDLNESVSRWIDLVLRTVGYTRGFSHTEFMFTKHGCEVIEINPRLGGGQIGEALCDIYGKNVYEAFVDMALGQRPQLLDEKLSARKGVAMSLVYAESKGYYEDVAGTHALQAYPGDPVLFPTAVRGKLIDSLADQRACVGFLVASGQTSEIALQNVLAAQNRLQVRVSPQRV
jgi:biotin carboxylase